MSGRVFRLDHLQPAWARVCAGSGAEGCPGSHVEDQGVGRALLLGGVHLSRRMEVDPVKGPGMQNDDTDASAGSPPTHAVATSRQKWTLTQGAFDGFLASLGPNRDIAADRYLEIRRNLVRLFE